MTVRIALPDKVTFPRSIFLPLSLSPPASNPPPARAPLHFSFSDRIVQWPAEELRSVVTGPTGERILADSCEDLLNKLLVYDSAHRIKAVDALEHPYVSVPPCPPCPPCSHFSHGRRAHALQLATWRHVCQHRSARCRCPMLICHRCVGALTRYPLTSQPLNLSTSVTLMSFADGHRRQSGPPRAHTSGRRCLTPRSTHAIYHPEPAASTAGSCGDATAPGRLAAHLSWQRRQLVVIVAEIRLRLGDRTPSGRLSNSDEAGRDLQPRTGAASTRTHCRHPIFLMPSPRQMTLPSAE